MSGNSRSGARPTPTKLLSMRGSWRANLRTEEPQPEVKMVEPPKFLKAADKKYFREMVEKLFACGILTVADAGSFTRYITSFGRWVEAERALAEGEPTHHEIRDEAGNIKSVVPGKAYATVCKEHERLLKLEQEFGLTPASRPRLQSVKPTQDAATEIFGELA